MVTPQEVRELAVGLAAASRSGDAERWTAGWAALASADDRTLLLLDEYARQWAPTLGAVPVSGTKGWLGPDLAEPSGFVAAVTSLHADGRFRQRAKKVLLALEGDVALRALALRCLDHVEQVRDEAVRGVRLKADLTTARALLGVLVAGRRRVHGASALELVVGQFEHQASPHELFEQVVATSARHLRRWAYTYARERDLLSGDNLVCVAQRDADQLLRAQAATWLDKVATPVQLLELLSSRYADGRLLALTRLGDEHLAVDEILAALGHSAARVREVAQWRARRRGIDPAVAYRGWLVLGERSSSHLAASLEGLADLGAGSEDAELAAMYLSDAHVRVRAAAVRAVAALASAETTRARLVAVLLDPSPRVCAAAAAALARAGAGPGDAESAWSSEQSGSRRAAWRLARATGSWDRVVADLRAAADPDAGLRGLGSAGLRSWLEHSAATTWNRPTPRQADRIVELVTLTDLDDRRRRELSFHAGVPFTEQVGAADREGEEPVHVGGGETGFRKLLRLLRPR